MGIEMLWKEIYNGVLKSEGHEFTFDYPCVTERGHYEYDDGDLFPRWKKKVDYKGSLSSFKKDFATLPSGISFTTRETCFLDERNKEHVKIKDRRNIIWAKFETGYQIVITVSEERSSQIYTDRYAKIGIPFRDKLLRDHRALMEKHFKWPKSFEVATFGVGDFLYEDDFLRSVTKFQDIGMVCLSGIAECYGFALAIVEQVKDKMKKTEKDISHFEVDICELAYHEALKVTINTEKKEIKPSLKNW